MRKKTSSSSQQPSSSFFHAHCHSRYSPLDAMSSVERLVQKAVMHKQPALALTDHGLMSGAVQLYQNCRKYGIKPFVGIETYLIDPERDDWEAPAKGAAKIGRYHVGLLSFTEDGYKALVKFSSKTHTRPRFNRFARCSLTDLAQLGKEAGEDIALTTGCYFGWLQQTLVNEGYDKAKRVLSIYARMFPHTFVEVQNHNIIHDDGTTDEQIVEQLFRMADELGLPVIATQDAHYCDHREKAAHALMKRMSYGGSDDEFPGDSFHLASTEWVKEHYTDDQWAIIEDGCKELLDLNDLRIPPLDTFTVDVPKVKGVLNPPKHVRSVCERTLDEYREQIDQLGLTFDDYIERLEHELSVINKLGMAAYFCIWEKFVQWCRDEHIAVEARGSANGSLVCFLLGVTQVDPIRWGTLFERFLSLDRIKPPDVDMDIEDAERPRAVRYMLSLYESCQIGTFSRLGTTVDEYGEERGSIMVSWKAYKRKECDQVALAAFDRGRLDKKSAVKPYSMAVFQNRYGDVNSIRDVARINKWEAKGLKQIDTMGTVYRSYGVHAGGVLLSGRNIKISEYIPTMLVASSNTTVTQYDMDDVEKFGLLKMDILGQATLQSMKLTMEAIGIEDPTDFTWIEDDDKVACKELSNGRTMDGVFHFEGYTKAKGGRELGCKSTNDAVLVQALYMPGCMDVAPGMTISQKDLYLQRRKSPRERKNITYLHPAFEDALSNTYGAVVFQEQVIQIMRNLGMDIAGINNFFSVVKDSGRGASERNQKRMALVREQFDELCDKAGIDAEEAWRQTASFVTYGFNRAHATGYGIRSYRTAYTKAHYPLEHMYGLLRTWAGRDKEKEYIAESRRIGIRILPPDVNVSGLSWTIDRDKNAIRKGLLSIKGIGESIAPVIADNAPYTSIEDMIERLPKRVMSGGDLYLRTGALSGTLGKLAEANALSSMLDD